MKKGFQIFLFTGGAIEVANAIFYNSESEAIKAIRDLAAGTYFVLPVYKKIEGMVVVPPV